MSAQPPVAADIVVLGKIVSAYGLRGAVHVHPFADDPAAWARMKYWWLGREGDAPERWQPQRLIRCRAHGDSWVAQFAGFDDRNAAEAAAGLLIGAPREALPATGTDEYYWGDLIGLDVVNTKDQPLGRVLGLIETAANDVRDRLGRVRSLLPDEIDEPMVQKVEADAQPVIWLAFYSERFSAMEITDVIERVVQDRLQTIPGVSEVLIRGARTYAMRIWLDPEKLAAHDLTVQDVEDALRRQNVEIPAGRIESVQREFSVLAETDLQTPEEFNQLILDDSRGYLLRLADVGHAEIGAADERTLARFNGRSAVAVGMIKQATANPLDISDGLEQALPSLRKLLPEGMQMQVSNDNSQFIRESIDNVYTTIWEAVLLVILIIFLFLRSLRATLIPLVTIPVSLIGACALMALMGFSINTLTLLAMVLAIGLVVDDAIVVLENIHRHIEQGMSPLRAAFVGSREIAFPVIAMTLTLAAVYAPIGFMQGTTGKLFTEFAWTLAGAVLVSGFVALTLSPMMCAYLLKAHSPQQHHSRLYNLIERGLEGLNQGYGRLLQRVLRAWWLVLVVLAAMLALCAWLFLGLRSELAPTEDTGTIVGSINGPDGATLGYTSRYAKQLEEAYASIPEANRYMVIVGFPTVAQGLSFMKLEDWDERERSQFEIRDELLPKLQNKDRKSVV